MSDKSIFQKQVKEFVANNGWQYLKSKNYRAYPGEQIFAAHMLVNSIEHAAHKYEAMLACVNRNEKFDPSNWLIDYIRFDTGIVIDNFHTLYHELMSLVPYDGKFDMICVEHRLIFFSIRLNPHHPIKPEEAKAIVDLAVARADKIWKAIYIVSKTIGELREQTK